MSEPGPTVTVIKLNHLGRELFRYWAELVEVTDSYVKLEAIFDLPDNAMHGFTFRRGDRFLEWHYRDRWYNVFAIHDVDSKKLKGWYSNITRPAVYEDGVISADDLALDLVVYLDGRWELLDEDEFEALELTDRDRQRALATSEDLKRAAETLTEPFLAE